jgi:Class III cytochrome C family
VISLNTCRRIAIALASGGLLLVSPPAVSGGVFWDIGIGCGYLCAALLLCLYVFPVRGDGLPHARLLGLSQHRVIGWCLLGTAILHIAVLLIAQPSVGRYLLPSAPLFMWCGMAAVILAAVLVQTGLSARSAMRRSGSTHLATTHIALAALMALMLCAHVAGSAQLVVGVAKTTAAFLLVVLPLAWFALRPRRGRENQSRLRRATHIAAAASIPLMPSPIATHVLLEPASRPDTIAVNFPHERHTSVNCVACHHNYVDRTTGTMGCIECHRSQRADLTRSSESTFHAFCRDCHTQLALEGDRHGPTRGCSDCHR